MKPFTRLRRSLRAARDTYGGKGAFAVPQKSISRDDLLLQIDTLKEAIASETCARRSAEAVARAKPDLLAASHEVRTPIDAIISMSIRCLRQTSTKRRGISRDIAAIRPRIVGDLQRHSRFF